MMKNYVINLTTASERRAHIIREFGKQGVDFEFANYHRCFNLSMSCIACVVTSYIA
ncbi:glycosyltransferase family 25 protein [Moraxella canis]|uniref:glycosyltransferase family 25 protein n=1 Tax=Moraxella canis TaxID=90239 RepID=UPI0009BAF9E9